VLFLVGRAQMAFSNVAISVGELVEKG